MPDNLITTPWPLCRPSQVHVRDPKHPVALLSCWTKKELVIAKLKDAGFGYNSVGQLYSERGLSPLIRNLLANRYIKALIICGKDLGNAGKKLMEIAREPRAIGNIKSLQDIPLHYIQELFLRIRVGNCGEISTHNLEVAMDQSEAVPAGPSGEKALSYPEPKPETVSFPGPEFGHVVTGRTIPETYLKMLDYILRFGVYTDTHYGDPQKEVIAMQNIITDQPTVWNIEGNKLLCNIPDWMPENSEHLETYIRDRMLSGKSQPDLKYTYGELIHAFPYILDIDNPMIPGGIKIDQFKQAVDKMSADTNQRSCVISLWNPLKDTAEKSGTPCLNHLQFRMRNNRLLMHALIRSNDMFAGWNENAYALRTLQERFLFDVQEKWPPAVSCDYDPDIVLGPLCITSISAHLYQDTWEAARELVDKHLWEYAEKPWHDFDARGQFEVMERDGKIVATLTDGKEALQEFSGKTARELCNRIAESNTTANISNVMYVARQAQKIEEKK